MDIWPGNAVTVAVKQPEPLIRSFPLYLLWREALRLWWAHWDIFLPLDACRCSEEIRRVKSYRTGGGGLTDACRHLLCVLLLCLVSLLHLARLFENQTFRETEQLSQWQWDEARDCLRAPLMNKNDESTLIVSSGSLIWADSFSLVYMSAYWLLENSESGDRSVHLSIYVVFCRCEACTNAFFLSLRDGFYLAPVLCSAPWWMWCGCGAAQLWVSGRWCTLFLTVFSDSFLLESETPNLHR